MNRKLQLAAVLACAMFSGPADAVTVENGIVLITQADAIAGGVTPADAPGFPITLSVPGSYRLASNLQGTANENGISVTAPEVTIDFAGFRLIGGGVARNGVVGDQRALTIMNGTIRAFAENGVRYVNKTLIVENMRIVDNGLFGINEDTVKGGNAAIAFSTFTGNKSAISCAAACRLEGNEIADHREHGIVLTADGAMILGNRISDNVGFGVAMVPTNFTAGLGENSITFNGRGPLDGTFTAIHPNACAPQPC